MSRPRYIALAALAMVLGSGVIDAALPGNAALAQSQPQTETLRPDVAKSLKAAQDLAAEKKYTDALAKISEAEAVADRTPYDTYMIDRVRASIAAVSGNDELAIKAFETALASDRMTSAERMPFMQALIGLYAKHKNRAKTIAWIQQYQKEGGNDPMMRSLLTENYYLNDNFEQAAQGLRAEIQASEQAGRAPSEEKLKLLASCALKLNDKAAVTDTLEKLAAYYPKKEYWDELLTRVASKNMHSDRFELHFYRLKMALGQMGTPTDYYNLSQLALLDGFPAEAKAVTEEGFGKGVLNATAEHGRYKQLRDQASKSAAEDARNLAKDEADAAKSKQGSRLMNLGYAYVTNGQYDKGLSLMEQGLQLGGLKRPEESKLQLGYAYYLAKRPEQAVQIFKSVQGSNDSADLARYWVLLLNHPQQG